MKGLKVLSTGYYAPEKVVSNFDFEKQMDTSDEWIVKRTGIRNRHFVEGQTNVDIGYLAAKKAIENNNIDTSKIGLIIVATMSPDSFTPSTACLIQEKLGLNDQQIMAFDISAACSGFVYGLTIVNSLLKTMPGKYALVIGSEVLSNLVDFKDRTTCILFGDGA
ncbi:MAG: 3-oxoacyl-ACP synthase, partial [Coprobacillaceae bacterium]